MSVCVCFPSLAFLQKRRMLILSQTGLTLGSLAFCSFCSLSLCLCLFSPLPLLSVVYKEMRVHQVANSMLHI